ncbi:putative adenylyl-sulfate kinase [Desulfosarcina alkanivorans]|uniref:Adenylyl-sulfate kinase n=1 Tax=Desulfosarcina alkanivorans TaxID=571177 RepID=A0A5K7YFT2_9BACT|nr:adenylyl-sulfate kinase [Desulfosarcina alkanivorans]BBO68402.1 putative adenylyl-sulfate kinase [Desulfosarcina alkanivorans]
MDAAPNIVPFDPIITQQDRHIMNAHKSGLVWFSGLSGSGKSTLAHQVEAKLYQKGIRSYVLDGDNVRSGLNSELDLSPEGCRENVRRIAEVAKLMVDAGILVFAAFIAPYEESRRFVRELMAGWSYFECYVKCSLEVCEQRDPKGLYRRARQGEIRNMTGISAPFEEPANPDLVVETDQYVLDACVERVVDFLNQQRLIILR